MAPAVDLKHALDRLVAVALLLVLAPVFALICLAIRVDSPGNPFFLQERIGAGRRAFTIFKFRTMRCGSERDGLGVSTAAHDDRITRVGHWLRATSLDELPQLFNIAAGQMSFIGPRPTLRYQVEQYSPTQRRRLLVRPGITGWAQVHGRNEIPWERRIELDLQYIDHFSLGLDARILWRTLCVLVRREGIYAAGAANDAFGVVAATDDETGHEIEPAILPAPAERPAPARAPQPTIASSAAGTAATRGLLPLLVIGAGGHARVLIDIAEKQGRYRVVGLLDDRAALAGTRLMGYAVLGGREVLSRPDAPSHAVVAIGAPAARAAWQEHLEAEGFQLAVLVHPSAQIGREVAIGAGTVLMAGAIVNSGSRLGRGVIVNTGASIDHDCSIGDWVHVAPGARLAGGVQVGERAHIGIGACVLQNRVVAEDAIVGGGAAVVASVPAGVTVAGVPARPLAAGAGKPQATRA